MEHSGILDRMVDNIPDSGGGGVSASTLSVKRSLQATVTMLVLNGKADLSECWLLSSTGGSEGVLNNFSFLSLTPSTLSVVTSKDCQKLSRQARPPG